MTREEEFYSLAEAQSRAMEAAKRWKTTAVVHDIPGTCWFGVCKEGDPLPDDIAYRQRVRPWRENHA